MVLTVNGRVGLVEEGSTLGSPHTWVAAPGGGAEGGGKAKGAAKGSQELWARRDTASPPRRYTRTP